jgi:hypothetical protein
MRRVLACYEAPAETDDPALASATEAAVILAREKYDRGEFRRAVVRRVPRDLFGDDLVLECGHTTLAARREEDCLRRLSHVRQRLDRSRKQGQARIFMNAAITLGSILIASGSQIFRWWE